MADAAARAGSAPRDETTVRAFNFRRTRVTQEGVVFVLAVGLFAVFAATLHNFLTPGNLIALVRSVSILGVLGLAMGLVVIGRGIDLAMVAIMVVSVSWVLSLATHAGLPLGWGLLIGAVFAAGAGLISGVLIAYAVVPAIFTTLAIGLVVYGAGRAWLFKVDVQNTPTDSEFFRLLGNAEIVGVPIPIITFGALALVTWVVLRWTRFGRYLYSSGDNPAAARNIGVPIRPFVVAQYVITALIAYGAGLVMAAVSAGMSTRVYNSTMIYDVLLVVVIGGIGLSGGRGSVRNVLVGTLLIGILLDGMTILNIPYIQQNLIKSVILLIAIIIDSFLNPRDEQTAQQEQGDI